MRHFPSLLLTGIALWLYATVPATAQNAVCPTMPVGNSSNACASTAFVQSQISASSVTSVSNLDGTLTISPTFGNVVASLNPAHANAWTALQLFNDQAFGLKGLTSGTLTLRAPDIALSSVIRFPAGSTDFSATGGTSQVVKQASAGAPLTVGQLACNDLSGVAASCSTDTTNATNISTGTLADGRLSSNVPLKNGTNAFTGTNTFSGSSTWTGNLVVPMRTITAAGAVTVSATTDYFICINKTVGAATTVNLPATPATGLTYLIKDCKGDAGTNNITVTPAAGNIDNAGTYVIAVNLASVAVTYNGTGWFVN